MILQQRQIISSIVYGSTNYTQPDDEFNPAKNDNIVELLRLYLYDETKNKSGQLNEGLLKVLKELIFDQQEKPMEIQPFSTAVDELVKRYDKPWDASPFNLKNTKI